MRVLAPLWGPKSNEQPPVGDGDRFNIHHARAHAKPQNNTAQTPAQCQFSEGASDLGMTRTAGEKVSASAPRQRYSCRLDSSDIVTGRPTAALLPPTLADFAMHTNATHSCPPLSDEVQLSSCTPDLPRIALRADLPLLPTCPREQPRPPDPPGPSQDTTCLLRLCPFAGSSRTRRRISKLSQALHRRCVPKVIDFLRSATTCRWCHRD